MKCQLNRTSYHKQIGFLQVSIIFLGPWYNMSRDLITNLPESQGQYVILVMKDHFAKLALMVSIVDRIEDLHSIFANDSGGTISYQE
jgi:hypothetical protein